MASKSSKVAGVRIPLPEYMQILTKASELAMPMSDYILQVLYMHLNKKDGSQPLATNTELEERCKELSNQLYKKTAIIDSIKKLFEELKAKKKLLPKDKDLSPEEFRMFFNDVFIIIN